MIVFSLLAVTLFVESVEDISSFAAALLLGIVVMLIVSPSPIIFYFMRRGRKRLEIVKSLQKSLRESATYSRADGIHESVISSADYDEIAKIERSQIIADRRSNIAMAREENLDAKYSIQVSSSVTRAIANLDESAKLQVDVEINKLIVDPKPAGTVRNPATGHLQVRLPNTSATISYDLDETQHRIRLYHLETNAG